MTNKSKHGSRHTDEQKAEAVAAFHAGESQSDIAKRLGCHSTTISLWVAKDKAAKNGVAPRGAGRPSGSRQPSTGKLNLKAFNGVCKAVEGLSTSDRERVLGAAQLIFQDPNRG